MASVDKADSRVILSRDSVVSYAKKWMNQQLLAAFAAIAALPVFVLLMIGKGDTLIFGFLSLLGLCLAFPFAFERGKDCKALYKKYEAVREHVPNGDFTVKRVQLHYQNVERQEIRLNRLPGAPDSSFWYSYLDEGRKVQLTDPQTVSSAFKRYAPLFLGAEKAYDYVIRNGVALQGPGDEGARMSRGYYYLFFVNHEPCIIFPESGFCLDPEIMTADSNDR